MSISALIVKWIVKITRMTSIATSWAASHIKRQLRQKLFPIRNLSSFIILFSICTISFVGEAIAAEIQVDSSANKQHQPIILKTTNGLPQVNIKTPTAQGISVNEYTKFNVNRQGLIINNSQSDTLTQLAGWIGGNPFLAFGEAKLIVNQVNHSDPTQLKGYIEIAGKKADLVLANPSGIVIDGGGVINSDRLLLATGRPILTRQGIHGFNLGTGQIYVTGAGFDSSHTNYTQLLTQTALINAGIWANEINITAGDQSNHASSTESYPTSHRIAIDTSQLGGMYAGKISLISQDRGSDIRHSGQLFAEAGHISIDAQGRLVNTGTIIATNRTGNKQASTLNLQAKHIANTGSIASQGTLYAHSQVLDNQGNISAEQVQMTSPVLNNQQGFITADTLAFTGNQIDNQHGYIRANHHLKAMVSDYLDNQQGNILSAGSLFLSGTGKQNNLIINNRDQGRIVANQDITIQAHDIDNNDTASHIISGNNLDITASSLKHRGLLFANHHQKLHLLTNFTAESDIAAGYQLDIITDGDITNKARIISGHNLSIQAASISNTASSIIQAQNNLSLLSANRIRNTGHISGLGILRIDTPQYITNTGYLYGTHQSLGANTISNTGSIIAQQQLHIGTRQLYNHSHGVLQGYTLSIGGSLDQNGQATGLADRVENVGAYLESRHDMKLASNIFDNRNAYFATETYLDHEETDIKEYSPFGSSEYYRAGSDGTFYEPSNDNSIWEGFANAFNFISFDERKNAIFTPNNTDKPISAERWHILDFTERTYRDRITASDPGIVLVGGTLGISGRSWHNQNSQILVRDNINNYNTGLNIHNEATQGTERIEREGTQYQSIWHRVHYGLFGIATKIERTHTRAEPYQEETSSTYQFDSIGVNEHTPITVSARPSNIPNNSISYSPESVARYDTNHYINQASLLKKNPPHMPEGKQTITDYGRWMNTSNRLSLIDQSPEYLHKHIQDRIAWQIATNYSQTRKTQNLSSIRGQSPDAIRAYLADRLGRVILRPTVGLISAGSIELDLGTGDLRNSGQIIAQRQLTIGAHNINNDNQGRIIGQNQLTLIANNRLDSVGGQFSSLGSVFLGGQDIYLSASVSPTQSKRDYRSLIDHRASVEVGNQGNGNLHIIAQRDLQLNGVQIDNQNASGSTVLLGKRSISIGTVEESYQRTSTQRDNGRTEQLHQAVGSNIQSIGNIQLISQGKATLKQTNLDSQQGTLRIDSKQLAISTGLTTSSVSDKAYASSEGLLSYLDTQYHSQSQGSWHIGSNITANHIIFNTTDDISITGSNIVAEQSNDIRAGKGVTIQASKNEITAQNNYQGIEGGFLFNYTGLLLGEKRHQYSAINKNQTLNNSIVGSLRGNLNIQAGHHYQQAASSVLANQGGVNIRARSIDITASGQRHHTQYLDHRDTAGLSLGVDIPIVSAIQSTIRSASHIGQSKNARVNAMAAANTTWQSYHTAQALGNIIKQGVKSAIDGVTVSLTYGEQHNQYQDQGNGYHNIASQVHAAGDVSIRASGSSTQSDIRVIGSNISGQRSTQLAADHQITLQAVQDQTNQSSSQHTGGWNMGISVNINPITGILPGITAGGNYGRGGAHGNTVHHRNSHIGSQGSHTTLTSGDSTTLKGAQVLGKGINIDAAKLNIESLQDQGNYHSKHNEIHGQVTLIPGNSVSASGGISHSHIDNDYLSVTEQSGVFAGDNGYQINIKGHTDLKGGIITSSQSAEDTGKNQLSTATLSHSDLINHAKYQALGFNLELSGSIGGKSSESGSTDSPQNSASFSKGTGFGYESSDRQSITRSGINTRNITITNPTAQTASGANVASTIEAIHTDATTDSYIKQAGYLKDHFDAEALQKEIDVQTEVSQQFSQNLQQANAEINQHLDTLKAQLDKGEISQTEYDKKVDNWQKGKVLLNAIATGLSAPTQSATGIAAATISPALSYAIGQEFKKIAEENKRKGITEGAELTKGQETAHILAHAVLGAAVSAAGGNNALAGGLSAGGAEAAAPIISQYLYGEKDSSKLNAEQKQTLSTLTSLLGTSTGAAVGNTIADTVSGSLSANSAVGNNWLTSTEVNNLVDHQHACQDGDKQACIKRDELIKLDTQRDLKLLVACQNPQSQECNTLRREAENAQASLNTGVWAKYKIWANEYGDKDKLAAHNKEYGETDTVVLLSYGKTPEQIASNAQILNFASRLLTDLSIAATIKDFKEADSVKDYAIAVILAIPGLKPVEKIRYANDFRHAYQAAKQAGDIKAAKEILELAQKAQKSPNSLSQLANAERNIKAWNEIRASVKPPHPRHRIDKIVKEKPSSRNTVVSSKVDMNKDVELIKQGFGTPKRGANGEMQIEINGRTYQTHAGGGGKVSDRLIPVSSSNKNEIFELSRGQYINLQEIVRNGGDISKAKFEMSRRNDFKLDDFKKAVEVYNATR